jgi:hypothetical protein
MKEFVEALKGSDNDRKCRAAWAWLSLPLSLARPKRGRSRAKQITQRIAAACNLLDVDADGESASVPPAPDRARPAAAKADEAEVVTRKFAERLVSRGCIARGAQVLDSDGLAKIDQSVIDSLKPAYPASDIDHGARIDSTGDKLFACEVEVVIEHTRKCTTGASHGMSGWRGEFITPFLYDEDLAATWTELVVLFGNAELPNWLHPYICGARGFAPFKPRSDGVPRGLGEPFDPTVDRVRPIAAGDFVMRVASSIACALDGPAIEQCLQPIQLGMGVHGGAEAMSWIVRQHLERGPALVIKTDEESAFQLIDRSTAVNKTIKVCSAAAKMAAYEYRYPQTVHFASDGKSFPLIASTGVKQGHGLGGVIYSIGKQEVYEHMADVDPELLVRAYYDDCYIMGNTKTDLDVLMTAVRRWRDGTAKLGGRPNLGKCVVYYNSQEMKDSAEALSKKFGFKLARPEEGFMACGVPLGGEEYVRKRLSLQVDQHERMFRQLGAMDPQCANLVLRQCVHPRMNFLLRTVPCSVLQDHILRFDSMVEETFRKIGQLDDNVPAEYFRTPWSGGGLGLRSLAAVAPAGNIASLHLCMPLLEAAQPSLKDFIQDCERRELEPPLDGEDVKLLRREVRDAGVPILSFLLDAWEDLRIRRDLTKTVPPHPFEIFRHFYEKKAKPKRKNEEDDEAGDGRMTFRVQKFISEELDTKAADALLEQVAEPAVRARLISSQASSATAWLRAIPKKRSLRMDPFEWRQALGIHCNLPPPGVPDDDRLCSLSADCKRDPRSPMNLTHALSCSGLGTECTARHDSLVTDVASWLQRKKIQMKKEKVVNPPHKGRADLWVRDLDGRVYWCDLTVAEPSAPSYVRLGSDREGDVAVNKAEGDKMSEWLKRKPPAAVVVSPLGMESTGRLGNKFMLFIANMESVRQGPSSRELLEQLSVTMAKSNVEIVRQAGRLACA